MIKIYTCCRKHTRTYIDIIYILCRKADTAVEGKPRGPRASSFLYTLTACVHIETHIEMSVVQTPFRWKWSRNATTLFKKR